jgi:hypothetical protein
MACRTTILWERVEPVKGLRRLTYGNDVGKQTPNRPIVIGDLWGFFPAYPVLQEDMFPV